MNWPHRPLSEFIERLSTPSPLWAGGAAAAIAGAEGWALLAMTFGIIFRKYPDTPLQPLLIEAREFRNKLLELAYADMQAVQAIKNQNDAKAFLEATKIPLAMMECAVAGRRAALNPLRQRLPQAEPDFGTAEALFMACQQSTRLIITANLPHVPTAQRTILAEAMERLLRFDLPGDTID